jgi:hypothetical protein
LDRPVSGQALWHEHALGMRDIGMAAFSVFFMQSPSFLAHQRRFAERHGRSNCANLFGIA